MTNVIELAKQAGAETSDGVHWEFDDFDPIKFYTLVRNAALEEAAQRCLKLWDLRDSELARLHTAKCAKAIESLKEPTP